ncbi:MAG: adenosylcobinamide-phosphate synthase CbiB [Alphaproteobacteria bacterium]
MLIAPVEAVLAAALTALVLDALTGEPAWLYRRLPHPVVALGRLVTALEARLWRAGDGAAARRRAGRRLVVATLAVATASGAALTPLLWAGPLGWVVAGALASTLIAQKSLVEHVGAVAAGLARGLEAGRAAVSRVVGRDPQALDAAGVARAAIESAAENVSDGVTAPLFWWLLLGPVGLCAYKAINTLDSMVGYRSARYADFGRAAARLDDAVNWLPARLTGLGLLLVGGRLARVANLAREAAKHRSPNAGWPEAAVALSLDVALAGPRVYPAGVVEDDWIHAAGRRRLGPGEVRAALRLLWRLWVVTLSLLAVALALV